MRELTEEEMTTVAGGHPVEEPGIGRDFATGAGAGAGGIVGARFGGAGGAVAGAGVGSAAGGVIHHAIVHDHPAQTGAHNRYERREGRNYPSGRAGRGSISTNGFTATRIKRR